MHRNHSRGDECALTWLFDVMRQYSLMEIVERSRTDLFGYDWSTGPRARVVPYDTVSVPTIQQSLVVQSATYQSE